MRAAIAGLIPSGRATTGLYIYGTPAGPDGQGSLVRKIGLSPAEQVEPGALVPTEVPERQAGCGATQNLTGIQGSGRDVSGWVFLLRNTRALSLAHRTRLLKFTALPRTLWRVVDLTRAAL